MGKYVINAGAPVREIEDESVSFHWEQKQYVFNFVWVHIDVDKKMGTICTHWLALLVKNLNSKFCRKNLCILCVAAQDFYIWEWFSIYSLRWIFIKFSIFLN